jgi:phosphoserine phosphatase
MKEHEAHKTTASRDSLPVELEHRVTVLEGQLIRRETGLPAEKIAVFDLDNTLLIGDIGDAVFAWLLKEGHKLPFSWKEYDDLLTAGRKREAYERVVTAMAGLTVDALSQATFQVLHCDQPDIELAEGRVPVPRPNPVMQAFLKRIEDIGFHIYVISATNIQSVRLACRELFGLPEARAFGIRSILEFVSDPASGNKQAVLTGKLEEPVTIGEGKVEAFKRFISPNPPLIAAGDSLSDVPMLNMVPPAGLTIWVCRPGTDPAAITPHLTHPQTFFVLPSVP